MKKKVNEREKKKKERNRNKKKKERKRQEKEKKRAKKRERKHSSSSELWQRAPSAKPQPDSFTLRQPPHNHRSIAIIFAHSPSRSADNTHRGAILRGTRTTPFPRERRVGGGINTLRSLSRHPSEPKPAFESVGTASIRIRSAGNSLKIAHA